MRLAPVAAFLITLGCGEGGSESAEPTAPLSHDEEREFTSVYGASADAPPARVIRHTTGVMRSRGPLDDEGGLDQGEILLVPAGGQATVDLRDAGRVELEGATSIQIADGGPAQVTLIEGDLRATMPPGPSGPRPPLRIATAAASIELEGAGDVWMRALRSGATWVVAFSGLSIVSNGETDIRRRLRTVELTRGRAVLVTARLGEATEAPNDLTAARIIAATLFEGTDAMSEDRASRELSEHANRLDESLGWLETETRRGLELTSRHREAVRSDQDTQAMRLQRDLATHAQRLHTLREVAIARWERLVGTALLAHRSWPTGTDPIAIRRDRVTSLVGL